jgi:2-hydroxymuconate-semialdehyde hydrolase
MLARGRMLEVAGRAVHVHDDGSGPAVLLLHGSGPGTTAQAWAPLAEALGSRYRLIAPDLPGFGQSEAGGLELDWAAAVVDALGIESCAVVGNSAGGALALGIAHARPRVVTRVVAVGTMGHAMPLPAGLDALWSFEPTEHDARSLLSLLVFDQGAVTNAAVAGRLEAMNAQPRYVDLFPAPRQRWVDALSLPGADLSAIAAPVLLIHGADDRVVPMRDSVLPLLRLLPDVRAHIFGHCGHASPLEYTAEFNRLVTTFLETPR